MGIKDFIKKNAKILTERFHREDPLPQKTGNVLLGTYHANAKGFGFVTVDGDEEDYYIAKNNNRKAFDGDTVIIERIHGTTGKRKEARVTAISGHAVTTLVGTFDKTKTAGFVIPDNPKYGQDIYIAKDRNHHAINGQKVLCHIMRYGTDSRSAEGEIVEILGHKDDPGVDILSIVKDAGVPYDFPEDVIEEALSLNEPVSRRDCKGREDLRNVRMVTIDGDDTKDFDDAVSIERDGEELILGVHIADVSHYVTDGSRLDSEARKRATSIYLADRVIPMLPHALSNGICSLNEGEDRLALSCIMRYNKKGKRIDSRITESVIRVNHRMTYHDVNRMLEDRDKKLLSKYSDMVDDFYDMKRLSERIRKRRQKRGSIDFDFTETKLQIDASGKTTDILPYLRGTSQLMIEDFMIAANECVAETYFKAELPFLYRTHDKPDADKIKDLKRFIAKFGYGLKGEATDIAPKELQRLLVKVKDTSEENLISTLVLRSMQRAQYTVEERGHYGLAAKYYTHFTSPIRRYPDLMIHRIIKEQLHGKLKRKQRARYTSMLPQVAKTCTENEKRADDLQRDVEKLKKVEYMQKHMGEVYDGVITGVTGWGLYVSLPNTVEGLVPIRSLKDDYYTFAEETYELIGENFNRHYRLGTPIRIRVEACDTLQRTIDFSVVENKSRNSKKNKSHHNKSSNNKREERPKKGKSKNKSNHYYPKSRSRKQKSRKLS